MRSHSQQRQHDIRTNPMSSAKLSVLLDVAWSDYVFLYHPPLCKRTLAPTPQSPDATTTTISHANPVRPTPSTTTNTVPPSRSRTNSTSSTTSLGTLSCSRDYELDTGYCRIASVGSHSCHCPRMCMNIQMADGIAARRRFFAAYDVVITRCIAEEGELCIFVVCEVGTSITPAVLGSLSPATVSEPASSVLVAAMENWRSPMPPAASAFKALPVSPTINLPPHPLLHSHQFPVSQPVLISSPVPLT
ncbi:uncharacterized protein V1518DRAFT_266651 [Limtongia smithiae]|uniref:uncharacterized protein n=1 Tax=Limtongia smithiae TaxID=1125753 RepID=UPI0034CDE120